MSDEDHRCHCPHVAIILHDFKRIEKVSWMLIAGILAVLGKEAYGVMTSHIRETSAPARDGERLGSDRIEQPPR